MNFRILFPSLIFVLGIAQLHAQEVLSLEDAVKIALENNYDIKISKNNLKVDEANVDLGYAGVLPRVSANINDSNGLQNASQTRTDGHNYRG